jgi:hypothetical protein
MDVGGHQADLRAAVQGVAHGPLGHVEVLAVAGQLAEHAELRQVGADLGEVGLRIADRPGAQVHIAPGQAVRRGLEGLGQAVGQVLGLGQQHGIAAGQVGRQQAADQADIGLEDLGVAVDVEVRLS